MAKRPTFSFQNDIPKPKAKEAPPPTHDEIMDADDRDARRRYAEFAAESHKHINAELARQGKPPLAVIPADAPTLDEFKATGQQLVRPKVTNHTRAKGTDAANELNPHLPKNFKPLEDMPSKGLPYPKSATISYRPYMFGEVEEIENSELPQKEIYLRILNGVETSGFDKFQLTLSDTVYLGLLRKIATMGTEEIGVRTKCPMCGSEHTSRVVTGDINFDYINVPSLPVKLELSFGKHEFRPITIGDWLSMIDEGYAFNTVNMLAVQCHTLDWPASIKTFEEVSDPIDMELLRRLDTLFYHDVSKIEVHCMAPIPLGDREVPCDTPYLAGLQNAKEAFIYPFRGEGDMLLDKISFGD